MEKVSYGFQNLFRCPLTLKFSSHLFRVSSVSETESTNMLEMKKKHILRGFRHLFHFMQKRTKRHRLGLACIYYITDHRARIGQTADLSALSGVRFSQNFLPLLCYFELRSAGERFFDSCPIRNQRS